jgi:hypothetical protein
MAEQQGQAGASEGRAGEPALLGADGRPLELADTVDCKVELRKLFLVEALRLNQSRPPVEGGCPGACPPPKG